MACFPGPFLFCRVFSCAVLVCPAYFRLATSVAKPSVQVVTHLCYSDFQDIMAAVDALDGERAPGALMALLGRGPPLSTSDVLLVQKLVGFTCKF